MMNIFIHLFNCYSFGVYYVLSTVLGVSTLQTTNANEWYIKNFFNPSLFNDEKQEGRWQADHIMQLICLFAAHHSKCYILRLSYKWLHWDIQ